MERAAIHSQTECIFPESFTPSLLRIPGMRPECKAESLRLSPGCCLCQVVVSSGACSLFLVTFWVICFLPYEQRVYRKNKKEI